MKDRVIPIDKVRDVLVTKTAIKVLKPEQIVDKIINFQFKDAAAQVRVANEIEISGFGKFYISKAKVRRKLKMLYAAMNKVNRQLEETEDEQRLKTLKSKKLSIETAIEFLKTKDDGDRLEGDKGGSAEQNIASSGIEGTNISNNRRENDNMQLM